MKNLVFSRIFLHCVALGFIVSGLLLSDRPLVRLQPGVPKTRRKLFIGLRRVFIFFWNYNVSFKSSGSFRRHQPAR